MEQTTQIEEETPVVEIIPIADE